ncbi:MAG: hypothetical protein ACI9QC_000621 [Oceanicoccus sp.]|jgi:uncharacterized protein with HEPN domain
MKEPSVLLGHILDSIEFIESFTKGVDFESFSQNVEKQDAVQRRSEIIGEAVKNLPSELKEN